MLHSAKWFKIFHCLCWVFFCICGASPYLWLFICSGFAWHTVVAHLYTFHLISSQWHFQLIGASVNQMAILCHFAPICYLFCFFSFIYFYFVYILMRWHVLIRILHWRVSLTWCCFFFFTSSFNENRLYAPANREVACTTVRQNHVLHVSLKNEHPCRACSKGEKHKVLAESYYCYLQYPSLLLMPLSVGCVSS